MYIQRDCIRAFIYIKPTKRFNQTRFYGDYLFILHLIIYYHIITHRLQRPRHIEEMELQNRQNAYGGEGEAKKAID